jgi:hypothetical protein
LLLLANAFAPAQDKKPKKWNFYPLEVGNTWVYKVNFNEKEAQVTMRIADDEKMGGVTIARLTSPDAKLTDHLAQTEQGVFRYRSRGADINPPFKLLPYPPTVGTAWTGKFSLAKEKGEHFYEGKIVAEEDVKVPAGEFKKALKVQLNLKEGAHEIDTTYWFVNNVGFVKQVFLVSGSTVVLELESFKKK